MVKILKVLMLCLFVVSVNACSSAPSPKQPKGKWEMVNPIMQIQLKDEIGAKK